MIFIVIVLAYLLGSINFGVIVSKLRHHDDVRNHGSGNAGATNTLRTYGKLSAILVFLGDVFKGTVAVLLAQLFSTLVDGAFSSEYFAYIAAISVILGHLFPVFFKFKGGKGVSTTAGVILAINPLVFAILISLFAVLVILTKYVSLSSITATLLIAPSLAIYQAIIGNGFDVPQIITGAVIGILITLMHKENIKRLIKHTESKISSKKK